MRLIPLVLAALLLPTAAIAQRASAADGIEIVPDSGAAVRISVAEFAAMPHVCVEARDHGGTNHQPIRGRFCGVPVRALLTRAGVPEGAAVRGRALRLYALAEARDGYRVVFSLPELDPAFTPNPVIVADSRDGAPLSAEEGPLRIIAPAEQRPARWVRSVTRIVVGRVP